MNQVQISASHATEIKAEIPKISEFGLVQIRRKHHKTYINHIVRSLLGFNILLSMFKI
jgi:hypothetical protein